MFERRDIRCELFSCGRRIDQREHLLYSRVHQIHERGRKGSGSLLRASHAGRKLSFFRTLPSAWLWVWGCG